MQQQQRYLQLVSSIPSCFGLVGLVQILPRRPVVPGSDGLVSVRDWQAQCKMKVPLGPFGQREQILYNNNTLKMQLTQM